MQPIEFIEAIGREYKPMESERIHTWLRKLNRFAEDELDKIFEHVLEHSAYQPKLGTVLQAARKLGYLDKSSLGEFPFKLNDDGNHELCAGTGLLRVYFDVTATEERKPHKRLLAVRPAQYTPSKGEFEGSEGIVYDFLYRCPCQAGDRQPKAVPIWRTDTVRTIQ